jgi:exodeoxyribonuclease VII small subunit
MEPARDPAAMTYDEAFAELGRVVGELEAGGAALETTIALYERAVALQRRCETLLGEAELRVAQLIARADGTSALAELREAAADA